MTQASFSLANVAFPDAATSRLYQHAVARQWRVDGDIDWNTLSFDTLAPSTRTAMRSVYSYILATEFVGLGLCGRLVDRTPEGWVRRFGATQVMDESRHVEFFDRVVSGLGGPTSLPAELQALHDELSSVDDPFELMLHGQVIESAAQCLFVETARRGRALLGSAIRMPGSETAHALLTYILKFVGRDESRHVAFGMRCLLEQSRDISVSRRGELERRAHHWSSLYQDAFGKLSPQVRQLGLSSEALLTRTWEVQRSQLRRLGFEIGERQPGTGPR